MIAGDVPGKSPNALPSATLQVQQAVLPVLAVRTIVVKTAFDIEVPSLPLVLSVPSSERSSK